ncbi:MAG: hypothetical protein HGA36_00205 [Candidatus Moranbacteria bacterium]|nr:hypothetical protein [Candidatus Moranbacteria bacterium]
MKTKHKGSILAYSLIILSMMLAIAASLSVTTIIDKKSASATQASVQALQTGDSGIQLALKKINANLTLAINDAANFGTIGCTDSGTATITSQALQGGSEYVLSFYDVSGDPVLCNALANKIGIVKSVGTYKGTARVVSVGIGTSCPATISDNDSPANVYATVRIGTQCWMAENLRTTKKPDGVTALIEGNGMYSSNPAGTGSPWGRLYDWTTAMNSPTAAAATGEKIQGLCPTGWHIPSNFNSSSLDNWQMLSDFLGGNNVAGGKMKSTDLSHWNILNADNSSGFAGVGAGYWEAGTYKNGGDLAYFVSSDEQNGSDVKAKVLSAADAKFDTSNSIAKTVGMSVRCIKD